MPSTVKRNIAMIDADTVNGKTQYPNTHNDWKIDMDAPSNCALTVTTRLPAHITTKTVVKTWDVCFAGAFVDSINASDKQMKSGPLILRKCFGGSIDFMWCIVLCICNFSSKEADGKG